jgi:hypothetical protein
VDAAIFGVVGVVIGAIMTGSVQTVLAFNTRRLESRTAARLLHSTLVEVLAVVDSAIATDLHGVPQDDWTRFQEPWQQQKDALARVLKTIDFIDVSNAFMGLSRLARLRTSYFAALGQGVTLPTDPAKERIILRQYREIIWDAEKIVWAAAFPWRERKQRSQPPPLSAVSV